MKVIVKGKLIETSWITHAEIVVEPDEFVRMTHVNLHIHLLLTKDPIVIELGRAYNVSRMNEDGSSYDPMDPDEVETELEEYQNEGKEILRFLDVYSEKPSFPFPEFK